MKTIPITPPENATTCVELLSGAISRFQVAAAIDGHAVYNATGSKAMAELLIGVASEYDRLTKENAALRAQVEALT